MFDIAKSIVVEFWGTLAEMSPYLLFGFLAAGILSVFISQRLVEKHLGGGGVWPLLKASLFGIPLPLCSCSVIPVAMSLRKHGAGKGATVSFLLSTPQSGADSFFVTLSLLGPIFAIFRPVVTFITGIIGGSLVQVFEKDGRGETKERDKCEEQCCAESKDNVLVRAAKYGFVALPKDIGKAMLVGLLVATVISVVVPDDFFAEKLGTGLGAMILMMFLGIPVYVCATASVPVAAALIMKGLTPGAALVFLMTGPATNAAAFVMIWKVLGPKTSIIYILTVAGCALGAGLLLDSIAGGVSFDIVSRASWMLPGYIKHVSAVVLLGVLGLAVFGKGAASEGDR